MGKSDKRGNKTMKAYKNKKLHIQLLLNALIFIYAVVAVKLCGYTLIIILNTWKLNYAELNNTIGTFDAIGILIIWSLGTAIITMCGIMLIWLRDKILDSIHNEYIRE
jgi:hypothetical protein